MSNLHNCTNVISDNWKGAGECRKGHSKVRRGLGAFSGSELFLTIYFLLWPGGQDPCADLKPQAGRKLRGTLIRISLASRTALLVSSSPWGLPVHVAFTLALVRWEGRPGGCALCPCGPPACRPLRGTETGVGGGGRGHSLEVMLATWTAGRKQALEMVTSGKFFTV